MVGLHKRPWMRPFKSPLWSLGTFALQIGCPLYPQKRTSAVLHVAPQLQSETAGKSAYAYRGNGGGAVGGAARLAAGGHDVFARGAHRDAIAKRGLTIESALGDLHLP
jgi:hypothetical protein